MKQLLPPIIHLKTTISNYYTKDETNSINIAKNEINLGVSSTYETKIKYNKVNNALSQAKKVILILKK